MTQLQNVFQIDAHLVPLNFLVLSKIVWASPLKGQKRPPLLDGLLLLVVHALQDVVEGAPPAAGADWLRPLSPMLLAVRLRAPPPARLGAALGRRLLLLLLLRDGRREVA